MSFVIQTPCRFNQRRSSPFRLLIAEGKGTFVQSLGRSLAIADHPPAGSFVETNGLPVTYAERSAGPVAARTFDETTHRQNTMVAKAHPIGYCRCVTDDDALSCLAALAHPTRLAAFRLLVRAEPKGLSTGELVEATALTQSTFSTHLAVLVAAGLVQPQKQGRQMIQRVDIARLRGLMLFLAKDCCGGSAELCEPLIAQLACC